MQGVLPRQWHRKSALCVAIVAALISVLSITGDAQTAGRPNIVVILVDDLDTTTLKHAIAGGLMPHLQSRFLSRGISFTESFSVASLGGPARATFLTGQYPHNHGVINNFGPAGGILRLDQTSTVATWLQAAGYRTGLSGRHVTGYGWWTPESVIPPGWDDWNALIDPTTLSTRNYNMNINGSVVNMGLLSSLFNVPLYQIDMVNLFATNFVLTSAPSPQPFFLAVTPVAFQMEYPAWNECPGDGIVAGNVWGAAQRPAARHLNSVFGNTTSFPLPTTTPDFNEADVSDKPAWVQANAPLDAVDRNCLQKRYWRKLEVMRSVDDLVGTVMWALESTGELENTVVIFTADNGFLDGQHRFPQKTPAYEGSIRVPLVMLMPGNNTFRTVSKMVLSTDLAPTIAEIAQATPTHTVDGRSLLPLIADPVNTVWRTMALFEHVPDDDQSNSLGVVGPPIYFGLRTLVPSARKFIEYPTVTTGVRGEYYHLAPDPYELSNQYAAPAAQADVAYLRLWLSAMRTCSGVTCLAYEHYFAFPR